MASDALWRHLVHLIRRLDALEYGPPLRGRLTVQGDRDREALDACLSNSRETHIEIEGALATANIADGATITLSIDPRFGFGVIAENLDGVLTAQGFRVLPGRRFFLLDGMVDSTQEADKDSPLGRYGLVLALVQHLRSAALYLDADEQALVFHSAGRFALPVDYAAHDLATLSVADVEAIGVLLPDDVHRNQREAILATAVIEMTKALPEVERFRHLLRQVGELRKRFEDGYRLFAAGFSYEKLRDQVEAARVEYAGKIHKVFSEIQNQLLGIPVATIVVATQMKSAPSFGYEFLVNTAVLVGCWVFAILMVLLVRNQSHTLGVLKDEVERQRRQLLTDYAAVATSFASTFAYLSKRANAQRVVLWVIDGVVCVGLVISHVVYFNLTPTAWDWVKSLYR